MPKASDMCLFMLLIAVNIGIIPHILGAHAFRGGSHSFRQPVSCTLSIVVTVAVRMPGSDSL